MALFVRWAPWPIISKGPQQGWENFSETHLFSAIFNHLYRGSVVGFWLRIDEYWSYVSDDIYHLCIESLRFSWTSLAGHHQAIGLPDYTRRFSGTFGRSSQIFGYSTKERFLGFAGKSRKENTSLGKWTAFAPENHAVVEREIIWSKPSWLRGSSHEFGEGCTWPSPFPPLTKGTQQHNPPTDPLWDFVVKTRPDAMAILEEASPRDSFFPLGKSFLWMAWHFLFQSMVGGSFNFVVKLILGFFVSDDLPRKV